MKKILVIGSGGAGKSTFSRRLSELTGIEIIHLDQLYWQPNWGRVTEEDWAKTVETLIAKDSWIMDGNYSRTMEIRFAACDTIIFLDIPRLICLYRVIKRRLKYRRTNRPDMAQGCREKIDAEFLGWIWNYPKRNKLIIEDKLKRFANGKTIIRLKSKREVAEFLMKFQIN